MTTFGPDRVAEEVTRVLAALLGGPVAFESLESKHVDLKEEAGRRGKGGALGPSEPRNEDAARALAVEAACMANTEGGGALIVGVADDRTLLGTDLDAEWVRRRIYDLTQRQLTVTALVHVLNGFRLLELRCPEALEPIRVNQKITWRVDDSCVEVDAATWHDRRYKRIGFDWSALASGYSVDQARAASVERARDYLRASAEDKSLDLAAASTVDLLSRLNVVTPDGRLTNAGAIAFVGRDEPALDYRRRQLAGGDSAVRLNRGGRGLLEELADVEQAISSTNEVQHLPAGLVSGQVRQLPPGAVRESIVNGCAHRDWTHPDATVVEHVGRMISVTSPGGFVGGVTPQNIITHPSEPRHRSLAELLATLRIAEREGIGVDRMVRDMVRFGYRLPVIEEIPGPYVRAALVGSRLDEGWLGFLALLEPVDLGRDLNSLLILRHLVEYGWADVTVLAPILQRSHLEVATAMEEVKVGRVSGLPVISQVLGVPAGAEPAWALTPQAWSVLEGQDARTGSRRTRPPRDAVALAYARARGRISTTELGSVVGASPTNMGAILKKLEGQSLLRPGRENRVGPGFFYLPMDQITDV